MVCAKCQRLSKGTALATPEVKKRSEIYYGSPATAKGTASKSATVGHNGIGKVRYGLAAIFTWHMSTAYERWLTPLPQSKLLSKAAKNPYAQYSRYVDAPLSQTDVCQFDGLCSSCTKCKAKITQGHTFCQTCAYRNDGKTHPRTSLVPGENAHCHLAACAMCGKPNTKSKSSAPTISGQKFNLK